MLDCGNKDIHKIVTKETLQIFHTNPADIRTDAHSHDVCTDRGFEFTDWAYVIMRTL